MTVKGTSFNLSFCMWERFSHTYFSHLVTGSRRGHAPFDLLRVKFAFLFPRVTHYLANIHFPFSLRAAAKGMPFQSGLTRVWWSNDPSKYRIWDRYFNQNDDGEIENGQSSTFIEKWGEELNGVVGDKGEPN